MKRFNKYLIFLVLTFIFPISAFAYSVQIQLTNPASGASVSGTVPISGRTNIAMGGSWNCSMNFAVIQYRFNNSNLFNGAIVHVNPLPLGTWNDFSQASGSMNSPVETLPPGNHTLYWRFVSGVAPLMESGTICISPISTVSFRVIDPAQTPSISFLLNGATQDITLNTPQDTFSYTVSASGNAERCYTYKEDSFGASGSWTQTFCNQNYSNISLDRLASSLATFFLGHPIEGENRYYVRAWNLAGGYSPTVERRITVAAGLPTVSLRSDPQAGTFGETTNVAWTVDNADTCTPGSNPPQAWWDGVDVTSTLSFGGFSDNSFNPVPTPPITESYELSLSCSNSRGTATSRIMIVPQNPGYCGDGFINRTGFDPEQCDLGALNGQVGSGCDNSCSLQAGLDFSLSADQIEVLWPGSPTIRARLVNSGIVGVNNMTCFATNSPEDNSRWSGGINLSTGADTVRIVNGLQVGPHNFNLECDNGIEVVNKNVNVNVVRRENGICGDDVYQTLLNTPTNLCNAGRADPTIPTFDTLTQNWNWQCMATGGATINRSCWAHKQEPPQVYQVAMRNFADTDNSDVLADGSTHYKIRMGISDSDLIEGGNNIDNAYTVINYLGAERGYIGWSSNNFPTWSGNYASSPINCNFGRAAIYNGNGKEYINLHSCQTEVINGTRNIIFEVSFNTNFLAPINGNLLYGYASNKDSLISDWQSFSSFSLLSSVPIGVNGQCGSADGKKRFTKPSGSVLCNAGNPTVVNGSGPWTWRCQGTGGGTDSRICSADKYRIGFTETR